jgi:hypothetical protein
MKRLVLLILALALIPAIPADGASKVRLAGCGDKPSYKPRKVIIACGDGAFVVIKLEWSKWSRKKAVGRGTGKVNTCEPSCAEGKFKSYAVKLTAGKPTQCGEGDRQFTRLTYTFTDKKPKGVKRTESVPRPCNG